jgi:hypothetical protein
MTLLLKQITVIANFTSKLVRQEAQLSMASTRTEVIRIVMDSEEYERFDPLIEALLTLDMAFMHRRDADGACFDLIPPRQNQAWLRDAVLRLQEGHFNAVVAPEWKDDPVGSHFKED